MHSHLREARKKKGLTQAAVAAAIGRDQGTVAKYETGRHPVGLDVAPALAQVLELPLLEVLYGPDGVPQPQAAGAN